MSPLRKRRLLALTFSTVVVLGTGGAVEARAVAPAPNDAAMKRLERIVRDRVDSKRSTGIVAGMVFPNGETRVFAYGDAGRGKRMTASSVFEIGSITKVFTATVLADMVQRGEVRLTDPVSSLLPPGVSVPARNGRSITLEDLATHSSGLPREATNLRPKNLDDPFAGYEADQLYAFLKGYKLPRDPGAAIEYSNVGEGLLGHALALRAGKSYEELVRERILEPLGMASTGIALTPEMASRLALGHRADGKVVPHWTMGVLAGAGALRSSIGDMLRFAQANLDSQASPLHQAMTTARRPRRPIDATSQIGLNWVTLGDIAWHDGGTGGFFTFLGVNQATGSAVVVLSNSRRESVDDIGFHLLDKRLPLRPARIEPKAITLPGKLLQRYVGVYELADIKVRITRAAQGLSVHVPQQGSTRLFAETKTRFFVKYVETPIRITFQLAHGKVTGFLLFQDGRTTRARKVG